MQNGSCHYCLSLQTSMVCKCVFKSTHDFFKQAGDDSSEVLILCLLYTFKCSGIKILNPNIPK